MKLFFLLYTLLSLTISANASVGGLDPILNSERLALSKSDHIIGEHLVNMLKFAEKGYINQEVLSKVLNEAEKSKHFKIFVPWLKDINYISKLKATAELINHCRNYTQRKETLPFERVLERVAGNYCRERTLEGIGRDIDATQTLSDESTIFIQQNLKFFLTKKNNFCSL